LPGENRRTGSALRARADDKDVNIFLHKRVIGPKRISEIGEPIQLIRQPVCRRGITPGNAPGKENGQLGTRTNVDLATQL
jgi:hypothetical protein